MTTDVNLFTISSDSNTVNAENPWPGLLSYREADQDFFYGRENESAELLRLVMREPLTVFFGLSGLGKSSLLQAGLFPRLRLQNALPIYIRLDFSEEKLGFSQQVMRAIASGTPAVAVQTPLMEKEETLWEYFHRRNADFWSERNRLLLPVLVFDQFEEIFTLGRLNADQAIASELFLSELGDLIEGRPPTALKDHLDRHPNDARRFSFNRHYYKVLLSIREDFLPELEALREQMPSVIHNRMRLHRMNGIVALEVVAHAQALIEPQVAEKVVRFVAAERSNLPLKKLELEPALLSVVCRELNHKRQQRNEPRITGDLLEGSQKEIMSEFYDRSISDLPQEVRAFVEEKLLTVSGYRDSIALENAFDTPGVTTAAINLLMDRRLIRREERGGMQRLELTHDLLTEVISASRNRRRLLEAEQRFEKEILEKERQQRLEERARSARKFVWLSLALTILFFLTLYAFYGQWQQSKIVLMQRDLAKQETQRAEIQSERADRERQLANEAAKRAEEQRELAERERKLANEAAKLASQRLNRLMASVKLRQAVLSRNVTALNEAFKTASVETQIRFRATAKKYPYKARDGSSTYRYQMFPVKQSKAEGFGNIALITYIMDHPSFLNPLISTGPDTEFRGVYDGVNCLRQVIVVIEYSDVDKPLAIAKFAMCDILEDIK
ncbi:MAG: hypothetical protein ABIN89_09880 [Chitinophagaceae bacterium]